MGGLGDFAAAAKSDAVDSDNDGFGEVFDAAGHGLAAGYELLDCNICPLGDALGELMNVTTG